MKIYFTAAIYQRNELMSEYTAIRSEIVNSKHTLLESYDVLNQPLQKALNDDLTQLSQFHENWWKVTSKADIAVVETSFPSSVLIGMEIASLMERAKPVICLYKSGRNPIFLSELHSQKIIKCEYSLDNINESLQWGLEEARQMLERRFTMVIPADLDDYLNTLAKQGISRSEFIRGLIREKLESK